MTIIPISSYVISIEKISKYKNLKLLFLFLVTTYTISYMLCCFVVFLVAMCWQIMYGSILLFSFAAALIVGVGEVIQNKL